MAILKAPLRSDPAGKASRWRVIIFNPQTHKQEWSTVNGTRRDAEALERALKTRVASGTHIAKVARRTFQEVAEAFMAECGVRNRRTATIGDYWSVLNV